MFRFLVNFSMAAAARAARQGALACALGILVGPTLAHGADSPAGAMPALPGTGKNLSGAACGLRFDRTGQSTTKTTDNLAIECDNQLVGFAREGALSAIIPNHSQDGEAINRYVQQLAGETAELLCEQPTALSFGEQSISALGCRNQSDGWPSLAVYAVKADRLVIAYGTASTAPYLLSLVGIDTDSIENNTVVQALAPLWSTPVPLGNEADKLRVRAAWSEARVAAGKTDFRLAQARLEAALATQIRLFGPTDFTTGVLLLDLALVEAGQEDFDAAQALLRRASSIMDGSPRTEDRAKLASYQASIASLQGQYAEASAFAREAVAQWREIQAGNGQQALLALFKEAEAPKTVVDAELAMALTQQAAIALRMDDATSASAKASEALLLLNGAEGYPPVWRSEVLAVLGEASIALGRLSASEVYFKKAIEIRRTLFGDGPGTIRLFAGLGRAYQREGMDENAILSYRQAIAIARQLPSGSALFKVDDLVPFGDAVLSFAATLTDEAQKQGLYTELYDAFQLARVPGRDETLNLASLQLNSADPALAKQLADLKQGLLAEAETRGKLDVEQAKPENEQNASAIERLSGALQRQTAANKSLRDSLRAKYPTYRRVLEGALPDLNTLRAYLKDGEVLATFLIGTRKSFVQLVSRNRVDIAAIEAGSAELDAMVRRLRQGLEIEGGSVNEFNLEEAHSAYATLFGSIEEPLNRAQRLIVVPAGPLSSLPFSVLVTRQQAGNDYRNAAWLVRRVALAQAPSIASFVNLRATRLVARKRKPFLGIANPLFGLAEQAAGEAQPLPAACSPQRIAQAQRFQGLAPLPETENEVRSVIQSLRLDGAEIRTDAEATETALRERNLADYSIVYFATHAVLPGEVMCQVEPGLALARPSTAPQNRQQDGFFDASEVAASTISANLVVLSACNTATGGQGKRSNGDALSGLAESFFLAGARSLLVTHWQVPSAATAELMRRLFTQIGDDDRLSTDEALRRAQLGAIQDPALSHPFFWGAFVFVGSGAETVLEKDATA